MRLTNTMLSKRARTPFFSWKKVKLTALFSTSLLGSALFAQPVWTNSNVVSGASSADISAQLNETGKVYYAVYTTAPSNITAAKVKSDATTSLGGSIVRNGSISITAANTNFTSYLTGMAENKTYYFYMVAEGATSGLQADASVKSFTKVFPKRQMELSFRSKSGNALVGYLAYVPEEYYKNPNKQFPLLLFLHGMGEKVWYPANISQLSRVKANGPPRLIGQGQEFPFIVISPQCPFAGWDDIAEGFKPGVFVEEIFQTMEANFRVDKSKQYLTGLSMGGASVWAYLTQPYNRIAAAIPIAGWADPSAACSISKQNTAVWAFQGGNDGGGGIINEVNAINACKPAPTTLAKATIYAGVGHNAWDATYSNTGTGIAPDNIYNWLLRQSKSSPIILPVENKLPVANAGADKEITLPTNTVSITGTGTDTDGTIKSYAWVAKSGPNATLAGTATATLALSNLLEGTYTFQLTATDNSGATATDEVQLKVHAAPKVDTVVVTPPTPPVVSATGDGLKAEYFNSVDFSTSPVLTKIDTTVNFAWGSGSPTGVKTNNFTARWTGQVLANSSSTYTFYATSDDGVRLWVNGVLIIDFWPDHYISEDKATVAMEAGKKYDIKMEYRESWGQATAKLAWSSTTDAKQIIPKKNLFSTKEVIQAASAPSTSSIVAFPVPASDAVSLSYTANQEEQTEIKLLDGMSQERYKTIVSSVQGSNTTSIDLSTIATGTYVVVITHADKIETSRLIVSK